MRESESNIHQNREQEDQPEMNLLTNYEQTLNAMAEIEGDSEEKTPWTYQQFRQQEKDGRPGKYTVPGAVEWIESMDPELRDPDNKNRAYMVYGAGGVNRWKVLSDGTVYFSEFHATYPEKEEVLEQVKEKGFEIY